MNIEKRAKQAYPSDTAVSKIEKDLDGYTRFALLSGRREGYVKGATEQQRIDAVKFSFAFCDIVCSPQQRLSCDMRKVSCTKLGEFLQKGLEE